jgi:hypothetical protein
MSLPLLDPGHRMPPSLCCGSASVSEGQCPFLRVQLLAPTNASGDFGTAVSSLSKAYTKTLRLAISCK